MRPNMMIEKIRAGHTVVGLANMYPASGIIEGMCRGWDFVWIDGQHGEMSIDACLHAVQAAAATGIETLLRVPSHEDSSLGPFADLSPSAVMVPMVNNVVEAKNVVGGLRFPPLGRRSYGGRRVIDLDGRDYYTEREVMLVAQIETLEAAKNAEQIIDVEGVDALFFGPDDMKVRMGIPINTTAADNKQLRDAMEQTAKAARNAGKFAGTVAASAKLSRIAVDMGYQIIVGGADIAFMRIGAANLLEQLREELKQEMAPEAAVKAGSGVYGG